MVKKILLWTVGIVLVAIVGLLVAVNLRWDRTFAAPYPAITASTDSAVIARGRYLAYGPAHCAACHVPPADTAALEAGQQPPLAGGYVFDIPPGKFHVPNLTPDSATGIGRRSDGELARMLRHSVRADGRSAVPFMEAQNASDEDLTALISFLRSQPPVRHEVPDHQLNLVGKMVMSFLIKPIGPQGAPPATTPTEVGVERGRYMANGLASCVGCHTERSMVTGAFTGPAFAGGTVMEDDPQQDFVTPNLTPDSATGRIASWGEEQFVARFKAPGAYSGSPMPWSFFNRTSEDDVRSIYRYLRSLTPVSRETGPSARPKKK